MIDTNIIIIEGLPGSGKSTMARRLYDRIEREKKVLIQESNDSVISVRDVFDPELWMSKTLSNWEKLSQDILEYNRLYVTEFVYFQNSIGNMLLGDTPDCIIEDFCFSIEKIILQHKPVLIYFSARDMSDFLSETYNNRDNQWRTHINSLIGQTPYGINRQLSGFEGFKEFYREYIRITKRLYESLKIEKINIDVTSRNWNKIEDFTYNFLEL